MACLQLAVSCVSSHCQLCPAGCMSTETVQHFTVMTALMLRVLPYSQLFCVIDILLVPNAGIKTITLLSPWCYHPGTKLVHNLRFKVPPLCHHSVIKLAPDWYQPVTKLEVWYDAVQGLRMAPCVCGIAPPTGWRTTSTMAWSASGLWPTSRAPTSKYLAPTLCYKPLFLVTLSLLVVYERIISNWQI